MKKHTEGYTVAEGNYLRLSVRQGRECIDRKHCTGIVLLIAITGQGELVLVDQYRAALNSRVIELPAGLVGDEPGKENETLEEAAYRELLEETGFAADNVRLLFAGPPSPGLSSEQVSFFLADNIQKIAKGGGTEEEDIAVHVVPLQGLSIFIKQSQEQGKQIDIKIFSALEILRRYCGNSPRSKLEQGDNGAP